MTVSQGLAVLVFVVVFILIAIEAIHRTYASMLGALIFVILGAIKPEDIIARDLLDMEILAVVLGLFLLVRGAERSGLFQFLAAKIMKNSKTPTAFAAILLSFTVFLAIFVSNIGAMLIMASITITMARSLKIRPQILMIFQAVVINIGGMTLWTGSIPNIIIGIEGNLSFMDFIVHIMPLGIILYITTLIIFVRLFKKDFTPQPMDEFKDMEFDEWIDRAIEVSGLKVDGINQSSASAAAILVLTIIGFMTYEVFNLTPAFIALTGGLLMMFNQTREPQGVLREVDWSTIFFLAGLFIMINGLNEIGVIGALAVWLSNLIGADPLYASINLMWLSGFVSSVVDNIPLSSSLSPIVRDLAANATSKLLWWGLVIGANLGGNMTPIGSPSNVITIGISEQEGYPISFTMFLKLGSTLTILYFIISTFYLYLRYAVFAI
ncbi:MAG: SLC13 family permease [Candidatus Bathyarchaeota archaeon]|jgi:Na+/H+ antiporter NhaD/arsenite permease-like protein|nr:SLC13 family permease [Candidatus Bathyarchaeota archaeon]MDP7443943.1 SLC13 family permease [Candidatus Bathyarchaeota archaeon]